MKIKDFLSQKLFQSESMIRVYKTDMDYLKNEHKSQNEINERLQEALSSTRDDLENVKRENVNNKNRNEDMEKMTEENVNYLSV